MIAVVWEFEITLTSAIDGSIRVEADSKRAPVELNKVPMASILYR